MSLFDVRFPENDLNKTEICPTVSELEVKCIFDTRTCAFVAIKIFINARIWIQLKKGFQFAVRSVKFTWMYSNIFNGFDNNILPFFVHKIATFMCSDIPSVG
jgi:hypothetical protein